MTINFKREISANDINEVKTKVIDQFKTLGFGILTEIDFSQKLKEKIDVDIPKTIILGACNPKLAYEVYQKNTDFLSLIPCNIVIRKVGQNVYSIEVIKPSEMISNLKNQEINKLATEMDHDIETLITGIN